MDLILGRPRAEVTAQLDLARESAARPLRAGQHPDMIGARQAVVDALGWVAGVELLSPWRRLPISPTRTTAGEEMVAAWWSLDDETDPQLRIRADVIGKVLGWTLQARDEPPVAWPRAS